MDYTKFTVEEFVSNQSFIHWVNKSDPEAVRHWDFYLSEHPEIHSTVEKARAMVINLRLAVDARNNPAQIASIWNKIQDKVEAEEQRRTPRSGAAKVRNPMVLVSLLFLCICIASWLVLRNKSDVTESSDYATYQKSLPDFFEQVNETGKPLKIQLGDGSVVILESKSRLKYKASYLEDSIRNVYLLGEAFFEVARNPSKPFIVHSNEVFVEVLGTSFRVEAPENGRNIVVSVKTGKVSVYAIRDRAGNKDKKDGVILLPNQQVSYERNEKLFERMLVDAPEILDTGIAKADFVFDNTPIAKVFKTMETAYGIDIIFDEEMMKDCNITAPLGSEPMIEKLKIICETIGATFEIIDARVVVSSSGCSPN
jgi:transmembrane sensor